MELSDFFQGKKMKENRNQVMVGKKPTVQSNALSHNGPESKQYLLKYLSTPSPTKSASHSYTPHP